jgi:hypothetical protein
VNRAPAGYRKRETVDVWTGAGSFKRQVSRVEHGGRWHFSPMAVLVSSDARLLLGLGLVEQQGGSLGYADTDSTGFIACEERGMLSLPDGSTLNVLSGTDLRAMQTDLDWLNPFQLGFIPHLLKLEEENFDTDGAQRQVWADVVSPTRYALLRETTKEVGGPRDRPRRERRRPRWPQIDRPGGSSAQLVGPVLCPSP